MTGPHIAVLDYGMGNIRSAEKALLHVGARAEITADPSVAGRADGLVLPGDGAFPRAVTGIHAVGFHRLLEERIAAGVPLLGICIGMQVLFEGSDELGGAEGLGVLPGRVHRLEAPGRKLPQIGWNHVAWTRPSRLTEGLGEGAAFYHVHSFAPRPADPSAVLGSADYGETFASAVERDNVCGVQFHPEKSSHDGLRLLANFVGLCSRFAERSGAAAA